MEQNSYDTEKSIKELIYQSCLLLDEKKFNEYLALCEEDFHYTITAYSPEVRAEMIWMNEDKASLKKLLDVYPRHNSDHAPLSRHTTVYTIDYDDDKKKEASVVSAVQVFKTSLDGGETSLFAVAKFYDTIKLNGDQPRLASRNVRLDTRMLGLGSHIPF
tara:strand:+ start:320 stop:799 length:480 start_codon:yes stop_codon:yes gene_type:complete